jgi:hypothetical protein
MASKIGEVLKIEPTESYIKRPVGPLITIELKDISKLPGYIRIPSMAEGAETDNMIMQKILYYGLPNQCRKCRKFGHHARTCTTSKNKPWEGVPSSADPPPQVPQSEGNWMEELLIPSKIRGAGYPDLKKLKTPKHATG